VSHRGVVWASIVLATILAFLAALALWGDDQGLDTNRWTDTSAKLIANGDIRHEVATYTVREVIRRTRLKEVLSKLEQEPNGERAVAELRREAVSKLERFLGTPLGERLWREANRRAHLQLMQIILHDSPRPVVLDLGAIAASVSGQGGTIGRLASSLPPNTAEVVVLRTHRVEQAQTAARVIVPLSSLIVLGALGLAALAIVLGRGQRRTVLAALGVGAILAGGAVLIVRELGGRYVVDGLVHSDSAKPAAEAAWDIGTSLMPFTAIPLMAVGAVLVLTAIGWRLLRP
jgi:hypothetical protein